MTPQGKPQVQRRARTVRAQPVVFSIDELRRAGAEAIEDFGREGKKTINKWVQAISPQVQLSPSGAAAYRAYQTLRNSPAEKRAVTGRDYARAAVTLSSPPRKVAAPERQATGRAGVPPKPTLWEDFVAPVREAYDATRAHNLEVQTRNERNERERNIVGMVTDGLRSPADAVVGAAHYSGLVASPLAGLVRAGTRPLNDVYYDLGFEVLDNPVANAFPGPMIVPRFGPKTEAGRERSRLALEEKTNNLTMALGGGRAASRVVGNGNRVAAETAELANAARIASKARPAVAVVQGATSGVKAGPPTLRAKGAQVVGGTALGQAPLKGTAKYINQGFTPAQAEYLARPYEGRGHHFIPRGTKLPPFLGGHKIPEFIVESPLNILKPKMSRGDFYERHYKVDPSFFGTKLRASGGGGVWRGRALGLEKYGLGGRLWYGSPTPLKVVVGGAAAAAGGTAYLFSREKKQ